MKNKKDYTIELLLFCLLLAIAGSLISCTKWEDHYLPSHCETIIMLSDKYNASDSSFIRTDTLSWNGAGEMGRRLCDAALIDFKYQESLQLKVFVLCGMGMIEKRRYIYKP